MFKRIIKFYFTGTDTTKKVVSRLGENLSRDLEIDEIVDYNFSSKKIREKDPIFEEKDLIIAGVPTIAGRVPNLLLPYLENLNAKGALAISIAMFGNRNVDDCLMELTKILEAAGARVIAGGAFVGEHSFSDTLAKGRPDEEDFKVIDKFSKDIADKINREDFSEVKVCGQWPLRPYYTPRDRYGNKIDIRKVKPKTDLSKCIDCKKCAKLCPLESIDYDHVDQIPGTCMKCCACIKKCPRGAKYIDDEGYLYHKHELEYLYKRRAEDECFL